MLYLVYYKNKLLPSLFSSKEEAVSEITMFCALRKASIQDIEKLQSDTLKHKKHLVDFVSNRLNIPMPSNTDFIVEELDTKQITPQVKRELNKYILTFYSSCNWDNDEFLQA